MLLKLALVVLFASIAVLFSKDFLKGFKTILEIKGMKLFLPLIIASLLFYALDYWILWIIYYYRELLQSYSAWMAQIIPFHEYAESVSLIILFTVVSVGPVFLIDLYGRHRVFKKFKYPYITSTIIFLISVISWLVFYHET